MRDETNVHHDDHCGQQDIEHGHYGNKDARHLGNPLYAAKDAECGQHNEHDAHRDGRHAKGTVDGCADGVALNGDVGHAERGGDENCIELCHPLFVESELHVVGRTANKRARRLPFVELSQGGLHEGRCRSHQGNHPHPEHSARSAHSNGCGHAGQVASAHARSDGNGKGFKRRHVLLALFLCRVAQQTNHLQKHAELHATCLEREH